MSIFVRRLHLTAGTSALADLASKKGADLLAEQLMGRVIFWALRIEISHGFILHRGPPFVVPLIAHGELITVNSAGIGVLVGGYV